MIELRPYQQDAVDAAINWIKKCVDPCCITAATGSGKSHIVAELARIIHGMSGKNVLCTAPSAELVVQNRAKYLLTGNPASMFSASGGGKCLKHPVVFGTPDTIINSLLKFGDRFAAVIIDECHRLTPTLKKIISHMKEKNPLLRVIGLSASPYRLGDGYVYGNHYKYGKEESAIDPFFHTCVYEIGARYLIDEGFLTPPVFEASDNHYDTSGLRVSSSGQFISSDIERAFEGRGRKTAGIVADVVANSRGRKGVMIFAATVQHAEEIMESLPPGNSRMVVGTTMAADRKKIIEDFKEQKFKYLVNVSVLTTGFDAPHVDVVAILRATESVALLQQIVGRSLRKNNPLTDAYQRATIAYQDAK